MFLALIAFAFDLASADELAPHALRDNNFLVGLPFESLSGPLDAPILAKNDARLGLSPDFTGALRVPPVCFLYEALPLAFKPPLGLCPAYLVQPADLYCFAILSPMSVGRGGIYI